MAILQESGLALTGVSDQALDATRSIVGGESDTVNSNAKTPNGGVNKVSATSMVSSDEVSEPSDRLTLLHPDEAATSNGTQATHAPTPFVPSPRHRALGLSISPLPAVSSNLRPPSTPSTPGLPAGMPGTPSTPGTPGDVTFSRRLSHSPARWASEDGIDLSKLDLRPVYTPPPGSEPLPALPTPAHPLPSPAGQAILPIHSHHHVHHRRTSNGSHPQSPSAGGSGHPSPLLGATPTSSLPPFAGPTLAETGVRMTPDSSHPSGQLERRSPKPRLIRLDSFGGEGLELKPLSRRGTDATEDDKEHIEHLELMTEGREIQDEPLAT